MNHADRVYDSILDLMPCVENPTPMVQIGKLNPARETFPLYAKLEWMNPFGSVKDRAAWYLLRELERSGALAPGAGRGVVEPTSGNTGISLAALAGLRGYPMLAIVPERVPHEKKLLLRILGAELQVVADEMCPTPGTGDGSIGLAKTYAKAQGDRWVMPNQYENEANVEAHIATTGPEIWRQTKGRISHLFVSLGTCGTITGLARYLKERNPDVRVVAVQPTPGHDVPGLRNVEQLEVSKLFDPTLVDEILEIDYELAYVRALELCRTEGLLAGPSSGLIFEGARRVIERVGAGHGVMIFPDHIFKYTSAMEKHLPELARGMVPGSEFGSTTSAKGALK